MGLPENRDIEPFREDSFADFDNAPDFMVNRVEDNEQMEVDVNEVENDYPEYSRLQMFDNGDEMPANDSDSSGDEEADDYAFSYDQENIPDEPSSGIPEIVSSDAEIQAQVWNLPRQEDSIELNSEKTQQILSAMSKFSLKNVPSWATEYDPSELVQRIKNKEAPSASNDKK